MQSPAGVCQYSIDCCGWTHFSMDQQDILYNSVWFGRAVVPSLLALVGSSKAPSATFCCCVCSLLLLKSASQLAFGSVSLHRLPSHSVYMYLCVLFFLSLALSRLFLLQFPTDLPGTLALNCSLPFLFLFLSHSRRQSHIFSLVSR